MQWRFADLPVRTKFMVTLGIPVLGMVLMIGKQVDGSIKRRNVMDYINEQSGLIGLYANVLHELQKEGALSVGYLTGQAVSPMKLSIQYTHTDAAINALRDPARTNDPTIPESLPFDGLGILRKRVAEKQTDARAASRAYRAMDSALLDELGRIGKLALDPETKDRMYAHLRLLNAKEALSAVRDRLSIGYSDDQLRDDEMAELSEQV
ncbi:MAG TPA: nitrate- and nitrite sensing domain-containing protein, partial [Flavobacteriales bacterium]|nr:nitrate- and nitrite sensing domain-containing protein [Flavobacteriales bacterium]